jgi:hypothetical protein
VRTRGAELAALDHFEVTLHGELLDHGGIQEAVIARVGSLLPFVVLKAFAIDERNKSKDSYDIVWTLNAYREGPRSCVERIAESPVINHPDVPVAINHLRTHFRTPEHRGPSQYAIFRAEYDRRRRTGAVAPICARDVGGIPSAS